MISYNDIVMCFIHDFKIIHFDIYQKQTSMLLYCYKIFKVSKKFKEKSKIETQTFLLLVFLIHHTHYVHTF